jgi:PKD repeat protein
VTSTSGTPVGTVEVSNGASTCTASVAAGSCSLTVTAAGTSGVVARYLGSSDYAPSGSTAKVLTVLAAPGAVQAFGSTPTLVGNATLFAVANAVPDATYTWSFGDGSATAGGAVVSHVYPDVGDYTATVTATNAAGTQSATVLVSVVRPGATSFITMGVIQAGGW